VIIAVNGFAVGIGCVVTYCCDLIVASDRAGAVARSGLGLPAGRSKGTNA
jgi:enoyl-CoA hydratase/carnithine racemase